MRWIHPLLVAALVTGCSEYDLSERDDDIGPGDETIPTEPVDSAEPDDAVEPDEEVPADPLPEDFVSCEDAGLWTEQWWGSMPFGTAPDPQDGDGDPFYAWDYAMVDFSTVVIPDEG